MNYIFRQVYTVHAGIFYIAQPIEPNVAWRCMKCRRGLLFTRQKKCLVCHCKLVHETVEKR